MNLEANDENAYSPYSYETDISILINPQPSGDNVDAKDGQVPFDFYNDTFDSNFTPVESLKENIVKIVLASKKLLMASKAVLNEQTERTDILDILKDQISETERIVFYCDQICEKIKESRGELKDWNEDFQSAIDMEVKSSEQKNARFTRIAELTQNFERTARIYGKIIVSEVFLNPKFKTVRPVKDIGGQAGGEKYICHGILFKFATCWQGIYGGFDEYAMKAAAHEVKSLLLINDLQVPELYVPLMTLIDYQGFRLVAESILPISTSSMVYGSSNAGKDVFLTDEAEKIMNNLAACFNLRSHVCGTVPETLKILTMPTDIEVHLGADNRYYCIDPARLFPPTKPNPVIKNSYLFQLFRPEFVKDYPLALCSDAYSKFVKFDPDAELYRRDIDEATKYLLEITIPKFANTIFQKYTDKNSRFSLKEKLHQYGINIRFLAVVRENLKSPYLKNLILIEMITRGVTSMIRERLRETKRELKKLAVEPYHEICVNIFNKVLFNDDTKSIECTLFWEELKKTLRRKFPLFPSDEQLEKEIGSLEENVSVAIAEGICTFQATSEYIPQVYYNCYTCNLVKDEGCCEVCRYTCHKNHAVSIMKFSFSYYCDCGEECGGREDFIPTYPFLQFKPAIVKKIFNFGIDELFRKISFQAGVKISEKALVELRESPSEFRFVRPDIVKLMCRSKMISLGSLADAKCLQIQSLESNGKERDRLFKMSIKKFEKSLKLSSDTGIMREYADALVEHSFQDETIDFELLHKAINNYHNSMNGMDGIKYIIIELTSRQYENTDDARSMLNRCYEIMTESGRHIKSLADLIFISNYCNFIDVLDISNCKALDNHLLDKLATISPSLSELKLNYTKIKDDHLKKFSQSCTELKSLELMYTNITEVSLEFLAQFCPFISALNLRMCSVIQDFSAIGFMNNIKILDMSLCLVSDVKWLIELPNLESLNLAHSSSITDASFGDSHTTLSKLYFLNVSNCAKLTDDWLLELCQNSTKLEIFFGRKCSFGDYSMPAMLDLKKLEAIDLTGCDAISIQMRSLIELKFIGFRFEH